jgi:hopanoid biosynthesis associated protein HpnK
MQVVINADDFGDTITINAAVVRAYRAGILTSTSLMVAGAAVDEAVALARQTPGLAVGLHVVLVGGRATLAAEHIPHLVDGYGRFPGDPFLIGLRYAFSRTVRAELARELQAQFDRFAATGLPLAHVDSHLHMHMHPTVFNLLVPLVEQYGAHGLRIPRDDLGFALRYDRQRAATKTTWAIVFGLLGRWGLRRLKGRRIAVAHRVYGLMQSGQMHEAYVVRLLRRLRVPTAEVYFHPDTVVGREALGPNPHDLATLLSPKVRQVIRERDLRLATYATLGLSAKTAAPTSC